NELRHPDERLFALALLTATLFLCLAERGALFTAVHALLADRCLQGGEGARDVLRDRFLIDEGFLAFLALFALLAPALIERRRALRAMEPLGPLPAREPPSRARDARVRPRRLQPPRLRRRRHRRRRPRRRCDAGASVALRRPAAREAARQPSPCGAVWAARSVASVCACRA